MVNWESHSKTPQSPEDGHIYCILLIRIAFCHVSENLLFVVCFTSLWTSISVFYADTARDVVTVFLIFAKYLSLYLHIFTCTYRGTHTQEHMYNQHTRGMATIRHRSLVERGGRKAFVRDKGLAHTHTHKNVSKPRSQILKQRFKHIELSARLLDYFLRSNKSHINQLFNRCR